MVLVCDLRRDRRYREQILPSVEDQWETYLSGERPTTMVEGFITRWFHAPYEVEAMFEQRMHVEAPGCDRANPPGMS
jgi:hypothetical protein